MYLNAEYSSLYGGRLSSSSRSKAHSLIWRQIVSWIGKEIPQTGWQTNRTVPPAGDAEEWPNQTQTQAHIIHASATKRATVIRMLKIPGAQRCLIYYKIRVVLVVTFFCMFSLVWESTKPFCWLKKSKKHICAPFLTGFKKLLWNVYWTNTVCCSPWFMFGYVNEVGVWLPSHNVIPPPSTGGVPSTCLVWRKASP